MGDLSREAIRRIDAKLAEIYTFPKTDFADGYETACRAAKKMIQEIEHLELEIVRCKDCKYNATSKKCLNPNSFFLVPADDDFCSYAERREE